MLVWGFSWDSLMSDATLSLTCVCVCVCVFSLQRHTAQLREELLKLPCPDGLEPDGDEFSERSAALILKELPSQDAEKPGGSQDSHCSEGQL